jgi:hypothetical protein
MRHGIWVGALDAQARASGCQPDQLGEELDDLRPLQLLAQM